MIVLVSLLGLVVAMLSFWTALNIIDHGIYAVVRAVFP
jgi:hypothetical protein